MYPKYDTVIRHSNNLKKFQLACNTTMKNNIPQAIRTCFCRSTRIHPPNCPTKLTRTNTVAKNIPQFQDMSMYLLCSDH